MMYSYITFISAVIIFILYITVTVSEFSIPKSISMSYYLWKRKKSGMEWLFTITMFTIGILLSIAILPITDVYKTQFLLFLSNAGLIFVGAASAFKQSLTGKVHYISAGIWAAAAVLFFLIQGMYPCLLIGLAVGLLGFFIDSCKHFIFWAEIAGVSAILIGFSEILFV